MDAKKRLIIILLVSVLVLMSVAFATTDLDQVLNSFKEQVVSLRLYAAENPIRASFLFFAMYYIMVLLCVPGMFLVTVAGAAVFGLCQSMGLIAFSATFGSTTCFLFFRKFLRQWVEDTWAEKLTTINKGLEKGGAAYLLTLRMLPLVPYYVLNIVASVTRLRVHEFFLATLFGMLPIHFVYALAGNQIATIQSTKDLMSPRILLSLTLVALLPIGVKFLVKLIGGRRVVSE